MRLLLDKNLSFRLGAMLRADGHDVIHVADLGLGQAEFPPASPTRRQAHPEFDHDGPYGSLSKRAPRDP